MGILMYELLVGKSPFAAPKGVTNLKMANKMLEKNIMTTKPLYPVYLPKQAADLIE